MENTIINAVKTLCDVDRATTIKEVSEYLGISYAKAHYWIHKCYKNESLGVIYPGLGEGINSQRFIYPK